MNRKRTLFTRTVCILTALEKDRLEEPDRITAPVKRQIAVSAFELSSSSSEFAASSRPLTLLTMP